MASACMLVAMDWHAGMSEDEPQLLIWTESSALAWDKYVRIVTMHCL